MANVDAWDETDFVTCLLVVGPPSIIGKRPLPSTGKVNGPLQYRIDCEAWFIENLGDPNYVLGTSVLFDNWYEAYKLWIVEKKYG